MNSISSVRLMPPKTANREIMRNYLVNTVLRSEKRFAYIHAGAGYGKTTLLAQIANSIENTVWLSLIGEEDVLTFVNTLCKAIERSFPYYDFAVSEYLPFMGKENFITILANAFISSIENLSDRLMIILDDIHTIEGHQVKDFVISIMKYLPENINICFGSREVPWKEMLPLYLRGEIFEISQDRLAFTKEEAAQILGSDDDAIYKITEGWPLAIGAFRVLLENVVSPVDIPLRGKETLYSYLFYECINRLNPEIVDFLKNSSCFEELDPKMLDHVLCKKSTNIILESLIARNLFITKSEDGFYRYHALFRECLLRTIDDSQKLLLQHKAAEYYWLNEKYSKAAEYAILFDDKKMLKKIILACYRNYMKNGNYSELRLWFQTLGRDIDVSELEMLAAKGAFLSSTGNFTEAKKCLDIAIPLLSENNRELYTEAMVHKARVLRNYISFEESDKLLDELIENLDNIASETAYAVVIEKLYNLCWNSHICEALTLADKMIENCARAGNLKVKRWYERYLSAVQFFAGRMKECVYYYEKSLELPEEERHYLDMHGIGIYAAKAYQMLGERSQSFSILNDELHKMRSTGKYEEMWSGYLFAAEIHYEDVFIARINGEAASFDTTVKYFKLADEYAPLYRKTDFQVRWAKLQSLTYSLMFTDKSKDEIINEIFNSIDEAGNYLKEIVYARLMGYYGSTSDYQNSVKCAKLCIEVGEKTNMMLHPTLAYGILARAVIAVKDEKNAMYFTERYLKLCYSNGAYDYFRARRAYDPILEYAFNKGIEPDITTFFMEFAGYNPKKVYIETLGVFNVYQYNDREKFLKMRTKKERELLAFLIDAGSEGATKEQIYQAIWSESESNDVKKLIGVNLNQIKKDLAGLGIENSVLCNEKRYSICRDEIECDTYLFEKAAEQFMLDKSRENAEKILSLYKGEYLSDFEALWATTKRIKYNSIYEEAIKYCSGI